MNKGLKYSEHNRFPFTITDGATIEDLIKELHQEYGDQFEVYLEDSEKKSLKRDAIVFVNGMNMVSQEGIRTKISKGDLIVFMIAAVGG